MIEDCAHTFFGASAAGTVGSLGDYAIASLPKFFPVIEGGILASHNRELSDIDLPASSPKRELKAIWNIVEAAARFGRLPGLNAPLRVMSRTLSPQMRQQVSSSEGETQTPPPPEEVRMEALADPLLRPRRLRRVERAIATHADRQRIVRNRRRNYRHLVDGLLQCRSVEILFPELPPSAAPYVVAVRVENPDVAYRRLRNLGLPVLRWDRYWPGAIDSTQDIARDWGHHVIQILCHQELTMADLDIIVSEFIRIACDSASR